MVKKKSEFSKPCKEYVESQYLWCREEATCWVERNSGDHLENKDVFIAARIVSTDTAKLTATVKYEVDFEGPDTVHITRVMPRDAKTYPELFDLVDLPVLNDAELHQKIKDRFKNLNIFTYIGPSLLIMNPFRFIPSQYKKELEESYYGCVMNPSSANVRDFMPHVWAISANSYLQLFSNAKNQAICISGESGAGKTVNTKTAMAFLTGLNARFGGGEVDPNESKIEDRILDCNPILEALGNAKTVRNDNSSRFGKYVSLFVKGKIIIGASIKSYLLEAIRVTTPNESERNYHIFFQMLRGCDDSLINDFRLKRDPWAYLYLKRSNCVEVTKIDDLEEYGELIKSMDTLNVTPELRNAFWRVVAAVLHCSGIEYDDSNYDGSSSCEVKSKEAFANLAYVLQVDEEDLFKALTTKTSVVMKKEIVMYLDKNGCENQAEAFAKEVYSKMFDWVIKYLNLALLPKDLRGTGKDPESIYNKIGLLDIFGFEIFDFNSIEQLCINFTNEKLHQLYVEYVFKLEVKTFVDEGLKEYLSNLQFNDNQQVIDLLAHPAKRKFSVFNLIDDQSATMAKDMNLINQFRSSHKDNSKMQFNKIKKNVFIIIHTAKPVPYTIDGFCEKNKDEVPKPVIKCFLSSKNEDLVDIYCQKASDRDKRMDYFAESKTKKENFIGYKFRTQMEALMTELRSCECSFMRCIKPNEVKSDSVWCPTMVVNQIRYLGLLDSIKIRKESYPFRFPFKKFVIRYLELEPDHSALTPQQLEDKNPDYVGLSKSICKNSIPEVGTDFLLFGSTRVFMKSEAYEKIEAVYEEAVKLKKLAVIQLDKVLLQIVLRNRIYDFRRKGAVTVSVARQLLKGVQSSQGASGFKVKRKAIIQMQRRWRQKRLFRHARKTILTLQSTQAAIQAFVAQKKKQKILKAGKTIWNAWKKWLRWSRLQFYVDMMFLIRDCADNAVEAVIDKKKAKAAVVIQRHWRGYSTRKEHADIVEKAKKAKDNFIENRANETLRRYLKGRIARQRIKRIQEAATFIQAYFKMRWTRAYYLKCRKAAITIQRNMRDGLRRKLERKYRRREYLKDVYIPFLKACYKDQSRLYKTDVGPETDIEDGIELGPYQQKKVYKQVPKINPAHLKLARFFCEVIDVDYINDIRHSYVGGWAYNFVDAHKDVKRLQTDVRVIEAGSRHTTMATTLGRTYCWGENDELQLGTDQTEETMAVFRVLKGEEKLRQIATGNDHTVILTKHKACFTYGKNDLGQLGMEDTSKKYERIVLNEKLTRCKFSGVFAKGEESYGITGDGEVVFWPISKNDPGIGILQMPDKQEARTLALGKGFAIILTKKGYVYSFGTNNDKGQLGLGHIDPVDTPTWVSTLKKERITSISCGRDHSLALTRNSKVFSWGDGGDGQLGLGITDDFLNPTPVKIREAVCKIVQVSASYRGSYALFDDGKVYWWGRNSRIRMLTEPQLFRGVGGTKKHFPVQIRSSWSDNMNITYLILCDLRYLDGMKISSKKKIARMMALKWAEGTSQFELPFCEGYSKYITSKNLDFKSQRTARKDPDPLKEMQRFQEKPAFDDDEDETLIRLNRTQDEIELSPGALQKLQNRRKKYRKADGALRRMKNPQIRKNQTMDHNNWTETLKMSKKNREKRFSPQKQKNTFKSSTRRNQYETRNKTVEEIMKAKKIKKKPVLNPDQFYTVKELKEIKKKLKSLMMTPRKKWTQEDFEYFRMANKKELKLRLSKIKL